MTVAGGTVRITGPRTLSAEDAERVCALIRQMVRAGTEGGCLVHRSIREGACGICGAAAARMLVFRDGQLRPEGTPDIAICEDCERRGWYSRNLFRVEPITASESARKEGGA